MRERSRFENELVVLDPARDHELERKAGEPEREIVLVASVDFPKYDERGPAHRDKGGVWLLSTKAATGAAWRRRCLNLARARLRKNPSLRVTLFDFENGTRERVTLVKGKLTSQLEDSIGKLAQIDYRRVRHDGTRTVLMPLGPVCAGEHPDRPYIRLCPSVGTIDLGPVTEQRWLALVAKGAHGSTDRADELRRHGLSVLHVYAYIESIGQKRPGTLAEFHLFGHASAADRPDSGTAFVNTDDPRGGLSDRRHPLDLDARANVDFRKETMNITSFANAFAKDATSQVWGCNWFRPAVDLVRQVAKQLKKGETIEQHASFNLEWRDAGSQGTEEQYRRFVGLDPATWAKQGKKASLTGKWVHERLTRLLDDSYMQKLANASGRPAVGGLPATYSEYDDHPKIPLDNRLSHIPMGEKSKGSFYYRKPPSGPKDSRQNFKPTLSFFERHFGVSFDRDGEHPTYGRGFAIYRPKP